MKGLDWQALWDGNIGSVHNINHTLYEEVTEALEPVVHRLGPPTVSHASVPEDSYGGPPTYGVLIAWNARDVGWDYNAELVPVDLARPSVGVLIGNYQNSTCIARVSPHPTWRIRLSLFGRDNYHSMGEFVERCLETLPRRRAGGRMGEGRMRTLNTTNSVASALKRMREAIDADPGYRISWVANLAMFMYDNLDDNRLKDRTFREQVAERLLKLIF